MKNKKFSGVLCHITSLSTEYGIGDFGPVAYSFVDHINKAKQSYWQILPIGNTDDSGCPYATDSAFGCAEYYISPALVAKEFSINISEFEQFFLNTKKVNFKKAKKNKVKILKLAYEKFKPSKKFEQFLLQENSWIEDYAIFRAFVETRGYDWRNWGTKKPSLREKKKIDFHKFCQFVCFSQLSALKKYANSKGIKLIGDLPIFVSYNSMDVWKNPKQFKLNDNLEMEFETGAAPDAFSETGQSWGTPIYNWNYQKKDNFAWWNERLSFSKRYFDVIRIDHFRGFCATWISKVSDSDASGGVWYPGPGADLFNQLKDTPEIIAEDLGHITPDVEQLRDQFHFPGMRVFQFMLGGSDNPHKLENYIYNSVAYSGTHDCDTLMGWYNSLSNEDKANLQKEIMLSSPTNWDMLKVLMQSPSKIILIQIQDLLGFGSEARFNYPGTVQSSNWTWKLKQKDLKKIDWAKLTSLTKSSKRESAICG